MLAINDYEVYSSRMEKSLEDKLFFENLVEGVGTLIDFGCADGKLLEQVHTDFPDWNLYGIDADPTMLEAAKGNCGAATYICSDGLPADQLRNIAPGAVINLSSVIHEVYSYSTPEGIENFWKDLFGCGFKYISIRDLVLNRAAFRSADLRDISSVIWTAPFEQLRDFIYIWGSLGNQNNLLHFLMKYRYIENWDREVRENYFPLTVEELLNLIPTAEYKVSYFNHYCLPFNQRKIYEDFGILLNDNTHMKILLERR